jgi:hypothetical protein
LSHVGIDLSPLLEGAAEVAEVRGLAEAVRDRLEAAGSAVRTGGRFLARVDGLSPLWRLALRSAQLVEHHRPGEVSGSPGRPLHALVAAGHRAVTGDDEERG